MPTRRDLLIGAGMGLTALSSCRDNDASFSDAAAAPRAPLGVTPDIRSFVRYASLAANGHNTQPWRFSLTRAGADILPNYDRRTPAVDPDDHHLFVSLGCAAENLAIAAAASGRPAEINFDPTGDERIVVRLSNGQTQDVTLCRAIPARQSTRSIYERYVVPASELKSLERAAAIDGVSVLLITDPAQREGVLENVIRANDAQIEDAAFMLELKTWLRFNESAAMRTSDGLYSACSGSPTLPTWLGKRMFPLLFTKVSERARYTKQLRSSSGIAVFIGDKADKNHWIKVGRSFQRFALQATALGLRHAHVNQPIEVPSVRADFAQFLGIGDTRPDLVIRFGAASALPMSLRRRPVFT